MRKRDRERQEEIEREAAEELRRVAGRSGPPPGQALGSTGYKPPPWSTRAAPPAPAARDASQRPPEPAPWTPRTAGQRPPEPAPWTPRTASQRPPEPSIDEPREVARQEPLSAEEEEEMLIEMALHDWAAQSGRQVSPESLAIPRLDPATLEAHRDRALKAELERQQRMAREYRQRDARRQGGQAPRSPMKPAARPTAPAVRPARPSPLDGLSPDLARVAGLAAERKAPAPAKKAAVKKAAAKKAPAPAKKAAVKKAAAKAPAKRAPRAR